MKKLVIFDMDGLMIDSERITYEGYVYYSEKAGYLLDWNFYSSLIGHNMKDVREQFRRRFGVEYPLEDIIKKVHQCIDETFIQKGVPVKQGLLTALQFVSENNYLTMIATSSDRERVEKILCMTDLEQYISDMVCGDEVTYGKPDPEIFLKCCEKIGIPTSDSYVIEDSEVGILAAYRAGIDVICVPDMVQPEKKYMNMTLAVLKSLDEIPFVLEKH